MNLKHLAIMVACAGTYQLGHAVGLAVTVAATLVAMGYYTRKAVKA